MIAIVDYGLGNLRSVAGAIDRVGFNSVISNEFSVLKRADKLILPGVGAFGDGMALLREKGLDSFLTELVMQGGKPVLGICLGFQLMAKQSSEFGDHEGLGWLDATVERIPTNMRLPHIGWNDFFQRRACSLFEGIPEDALFYYVHSYHMKCESSEDVIGESDYDGLFTASIQHGNVYGTQFHPEKSQRWGLEVLYNFLSKA